MKEKPIARVMDALPGLTHALHLYSHNNELTRTALANLGGSRHALQHRPVRSIEAIVEEVAKSGGSQLDLLQQLTETFLQLTQEHTELAELANHIGSGTLSEVLPGGRTMVIDRNR